MITRITAEVPKQNQSHDGMTRVIDELISKNTPLTKQVELIKTLRAFSCIGEGLAYKAMVAHPATLLYLVEALDPDKS